MTAIPLVVFAILVLLVEAISLRRIRRLDYRLRRLELHEALDARRRHLATLAARGGGGAP